MIVGTSLGEDLSSSGNRVKGTAAGIIAGLAVSTFFGPSAIAVGLAATATMLLALALGWGIPVARIGVTVCLIALVFYGHNTVEYDVLRAVNTGIGVVVGLAVSFFVWPVRARDTVAPATHKLVAAISKLLDALAAGAPDLRPAQLAVYDAIAALVKAGRDAKVERGLRLQSESVDARALDALQLGLEVLAATLAARGHAPAAPQVQLLRERLADLSHATNYRTEGSTT